MPFISLDLEPGFLNIDEKTHKKREKFGKNLCSESDYIMYI